MSFRLFSCSNVKAIQKLNETELRLGQKGSWHDQYSNSAYVFIGELLTLVQKGNDSYGVHVWWLEFSYLNLMSQPSLLTMQHSAHRKCIRTIVHRHTDSSTWADWGWCTVVCTSLCDKIPKLA